MESDRKVVDRKAVEAIAPVLLEAGFTVEQGAAIAASIEVVVQAARKKQDEKIEKATSLIGDFVKLRTEDSELTLEISRLVQALTDDFERLEETVEKMKRG